MKLDVYPTNINAYSDKGAEIKECFLKEAHALLKEVGTHLAFIGLVEQKIWKNRGGIAVSGEVYGEFFKPGKNIGVFVEVGTSCVRGHFSRKEDGVCIRAVWRCRHRDHAHTPEGRNEWIDPNYNDQQIASCLETIWLDAQRTVEKSKWVVGN